jgi:hypothetical protein
MPIVQSRHKDPERIVEDKREKPSAPAVQSDGPRVRSENLRTDGGLQLPSGYIAYPDYHDYPVCCTTSTTEWRKP